MVDMELVVRKIGLPSYVGAQPCVTAFYIFTQGTGVGLSYPASKGLESAIFSQYVPSQSRVQRSAMRWENPPAA